MSSEGLCPDAVIGSGKRTRRLEMELERLTDLKSNTQVIEIAEYTACSCLPFASSQGGGGKDSKSRRASLPNSSRFFLVGELCCVVGQKKKKNNGN